MTYPKECPVFEVVLSFLDVRAGDIVEGVWIGDDGLEVRIVSPGPGTRAMFVEAREGWAMCADELRPLTPAAVAMLALIRE